MILICPKCHKQHQYQSRDEFEYRCIHDGFLASIVTKFKKKSSRLTANSLDIMSPSLSSMSQVLSSNSSISNVATRSNTNSFMAKCQACSQRNELTVCEHCDSVICLTCAKAHRQTTINEMKHIWATCQITFNDLEQRSGSIHCDIFIFEQYFLMFCSLLSKNNSITTTNNVNIEQNN
jgi:hypothetical protein